MRENYDKIARLIIGKPIEVERFPDEPYETIFLFGAGASFGCGNVYPHQPPLGESLYDKLKEVFPHSWGALTKELKVHFNVSFENGMEILWENNTEKSVLLLQQMGIYFSTFQPAIPDGTLYHKIIDKINKRGKNDILLSTLNYDCLLDGELTKSGIIPDYMFSPGGQIPIIKLHGSCNWFVDIQNISRNVNISSNVWIEAQIFALNSYDKVRAQLTGDTPFYPVFCLFTKNKPAPLCNNFFNYLQIEWAKKIMSASQIAIIGVKPFPDDTHIWGPLASTKARIFYIGDKNAYQIWHNKSGRISETTFIAEYFENGIDNLLGELFVE